MKKISVASLKKMRFAVLFFLTLSLRSADQTEIGEIESFRDGGSYGVTLIRSTSDNNVKEREAYFVVGRNGSPYFGAVIKVPPGQVSTYLQDDQIRDEVKSDSLNDEIAIATLIRKMKIISASYVSFSSEQLEKAIKLVELDNAGHISAEERQLYWDWNRKDNLRSFLVAALMSKLLRSSK